MPVAPAGLGQCAPRDPARPVPVVRGTFVGSDGLVVSCRPPCRFSLWRTGDAIPEGYREALGSEYICASKVRPKTIDEVNRHCEAVGCFTLPAAAPSRPAREPRVARTARTPRLPRRPRRPREPRQPRRNRKPRAARAPRPPRSLSIYGFYRPVAGLWIHGAVARELRPAFQSSTLVIGTSCWLGLFDELVKLRQSLSGGVWWKNEQTIRDYIEEHNTGDPRCGGPGLTACQRRAGAAASAFEMFTGFVHRVLPSPVPVRAQVRRLLPRRIRVLAGVPLIPAPPPAREPGRPSARLVAWERHVALHGRAGDPLVVSGVMGFFEDGPGPETIPGIQEWRRAPEFDYRFARGLGLGVAR